MIKKMTKDSSIESRLELLCAGCETVVSEGELRAKLEKSATTGKPLIVKAGFDPSTPDIHIGHTVVMRKMRAFQELGHEVHFVVGDFTAMIGDPSGKNKTRPQLTKEQVRENAETYRSQAVKVLDEGGTRLDFNSAWLSDLGSEGMVRLLGRVTVARMIEREDFATRLRENRPVSMHELVYPLCQAYDSVALAADVELGGTDQTWNLLMGRDMMRWFGLEPQVVMTLPLLEGLDGVEKMSKSLGNAIPIEAKPREMFGMVMSISDELMWRYMTLLSGKSSREIGELRGKVDGGAIHPMEAKKDLALELVSAFHGEEAARDAGMAFEAQFQRRERPDDVPETFLSPADLPMPVVELLTREGLTSSRSEARRMIKAGAVKLDGEKVSDLHAVLTAEKRGAVLFKVGKRKFLEVRVRG